jgi:2-iminobutanoate/2-iminopropanoate deaminase
MSEKRLIGALTAFLALPSGATATDKEVISSDDAPEAIGPYSQAIGFRDLVFLAGQIAIDPATNEVVHGSIEEQTALVLDNLRAVLEAGGLGMENVLSTTVFLADLDDFPAMNEVYATYFESDPPARATVEVARLPRDVLVEIAAIAGRCRRPRTDRRRE